MDTGASASIIGTSTYQSLWTKKQAPELKQTNVKLRTYTGEYLKIAGAATVDVKHKDQNRKLPLLVVEGNGPSLLGRDWLEKLTLNWQQIHRLHSGHTLSLSDVLTAHPEVFKEELGLVKGVEAKITVDPSATPRFYRPRPVPYALRPRVEKELERLERQGIIEPVQFSDWAAPIVPVVKKDRTIRICGDYKVTLNRAAKVDTYPLPRIEDLFAILGKGKMYTKLDLAHAYQQILLDQGSRMLATINTHKGLYKYNRLPFGVSSAASIFHRVIERILQGIPNVIVYIDDILLTGSSEEDHLRTLDLVLSRLKEHGVCLKQEK